MADIDYAALAKKHGGEVAPPSGGIDYVALAQKHGGEISGTPSLPVMPKPKPVEPYYVNPTTGARAGKLLDADIFSATGTSAQDLEDRDARAVYLKSHPEEAKRSGQHRLLKELDVALSTPMPGEMVVDAGVPVAKTAGKLAKMLPGGETVSRYGKRVAQLGREIQEIWKGKAPEPEAPPQSLSEYSSSLARKLKIGSAPAEAPREGYVPPRPLGPKVKPSERAATFKDEPPTATPPQVTFKAKPGVQRKLNIGSAPGERPGTSPAYSGKKPTQAPSVRMAKDAEKAAEKEAAEEGAESATAPPPGAKKPEAKTATPPGAKTPERIPPTKQILRADIFVNAGDDFGIKTPAQKDALRKVIRD